MTVVHEPARIRFDNAMRLFDEFVQATVKSPDAATLRGLERRFAERLQIQPSYWSQIKGGSRQIGERLARQFEQLCRKPPGWMDQWHGDGPAYAPSARTAPASTSGSKTGAPAGRDSASTAPGATDASWPGSDSQARDDDERFIVGLVLTYYRRHPQRARQRLLDLLGEVLTPPAEPPGSVGAGSVAGTRSPSHGGRPGPTTGAAPASSAAAPSPADDRALWARAQAAVQPLKPRR